LEAELQGKEMMVAVEMVAVVAVLEVLVHAEMVVMREAAETALIPILLGQVQLALA
jgi:hypothetical protein